MKKIFLSLVAVAMVFVISGCEKVELGKYVQGTYEGTTIDNYGGEENMAIATIVVNNEGKIESVNLDTTYKESTKKELRDDYNMKTYNPNAAGEWYEQVEALEKAIVEHQGLDFLKLNAEGKTDVVSGCTIKIDALVKASQIALEKAAK